MSDEFLNLEQTKIIKEILTTERKYVEDLKKLQDVYEKQLKENKLFEEKDIKLLFSSSILLNYNNYFLTKLEEYYSKNIYKFVRGIY
jgi:hypothetical protein